MYHAIFRSRLRQAFRDINQGNFDQALSQFSPRIEHAFYGDHALAGERTGIEVTRAWYARLARLLPDLKFELTNVVVSGWPWDTVAAVEWRDRYTVHGKPMSNQGVHMFRFRWGKCIGLRIYCDTQKLAAALQMLAAPSTPNALPEAVATPIEGSA